MHLVSRVSEWNKSQIDKRSNNLISATLVILVSVIHFAIATVEMFFWRLPKVHSRLGFDTEGANKVAPIVANAGLYNSFIACGLIFGLSSWGSPSMILFFLTCVIVAGIYGALTLKPTTLVLQSIPGAIAWVAVWLSK